MRRMGKVVGLGLLEMVVTGMTLWGMGALYYAPLPTPLRGGLAAAFGLATAGVFLGLSHRRRTLLGFVLVWGVLVGWWSTIAPSNDRDWQPDVAVLPSATVDGDRVTLHNIRNIAYRTATDFTPRYYDKTFELRLAAVLLAAVLFAELWGDAKLAELLFVSVLRTLALVLVFGLLRHLVRGGLEWAGRSAVSRHAALLGRHTALVVQRLAWLGDVLVGVVMLSGLLMTWQVYDSPGEAITGLLSVHATIGSQQITIGLVMLAIAALGVSYLASWMLQTLLTENVLARRHVDTGVSTSVSRLLHYALVSIGFVLALVVLGVDLTKMTLLVSALGVGIGFGLQTIVNNFVCGLILLLDRPIRVGDTIDLDGQSAKIAKIGLCSTMVRTPDQADVIVPNTELITNRVTNWTLTDRQARSVIPVGVAYGSDIALVMQTLKECALAHPGVLHSSEPQELFRSFGDSSLDFELCAWVADLDTRSQVASDLRQDIDRRFRQAGIEIPFPQRDLHVRSVENMNTMAAIVKAPLD